MRVAVAVFCLMSAGAASASAAEPLEKQFFDYFAQRCEAALQAEWKAANLDPDNPEAHVVMAKYCSCTSLAAVSFLNAEEIIAFANDPEQEPASSKMKPHFAACQERARKAANPQQPSNPG